MPIGPAIRRLFGPHERRVSEAYRAIYFDVDAFIRRIRAWTPDARRILEVGCGEGAITQRLVAAYPGAAITGIDISPRVGRLYEGPAGAARFLETTVQELAAAEPGRYDLVVLADVLHHVPDAMRQPLLDAIRTLMAPGACLAFKEWERNGTPIYWLGYASDRWITGDRIQYMTRDEVRGRIAAAFGAEAMVDEARIAPWRNNIATLVRV